MELCKFLWGNPCTAVEPFSHLGFCLWDFWFSMHFSLCCVEDPGEGFGCVAFAPLFVSCRKLQLSPFEHCPLAFHYQQSPRLLCSRCFVPLILDHGACFKMSISGFKILQSQILLDTSFSYCLQSAMIRSSWTIPIRSWSCQTLVFLTCTCFTRCHQMGFVSSTIEFRPIINRNPEYHHFEEQL